MSTRTLHRKLRFAYNQLRHKCLRKVHGLACSNITGTDVSENEARAWDLTKDQPGSPLISSPTWDFSIFFYKLEFCWNPLVASRKGMTKYLSQSKKVGVVLTASQDPTEDVVTFSAELSCNEKANQWQRSFNILDRTL